MSVATQYKHLQTVTGSDVAQTFASEIYHRL